MSDETEWEVWKSLDEGSISVFPRSNASARSSLEPDAVHVYSIVASSLEEAKSILRENEGWHK